MKDMKIPGFVWAVGIILAVAIIHSYQPWISANTPFDAYMIDIGLALLVGLLKSGTVKLEAEQLNQALDVINLLLHKPSRVAPEGMRGMEDAPPALVDVEVPQRPNLMKRWLVG